MKSSLSVMSWCVWESRGQVLEILVNSHRFCRELQYSFSTCFLPLKVFMMAARNADSMTPAQGQFHPHRPRDEPATTSGVSSFRIRLRENGHWSALAERHRQYKVSLCISSYLCPFLFNTLTNLSLIPFTAQTRCQSLAKGPK
jgi:hypothetical protein